MDFRRTDGRQHIYTTPQPPYHWATVPSFWRAIEDAVSSGWSDLVLEESCFGGVFSLYGRRESGR